MNRASIAAIFVVGLLLLSAMARAELRGDWQMRSERGGKVVHLQLERRHSNNGQSVALSSFSGLSAAQLEAATSAPVSFALHRDAGSFAFSGNAGRGSGRGEFVFTGD